MDPRDALFLSLLAAEDIVSRLDEQLRSYGARGGLLARLDFEEASAWAWNSGFSATTEDLVLHHEAMDLRPPTQELRAADGYARARRKAASAGPELLSFEGARWLMALRRTPPPPSRETPDAPSPALASDGSDMFSALDSQIRALEAESTESPDVDFREWLSILLAPQTGRPPLLQAALALEAWTLIEPYPRHTYLGPLLVGVWLRSVKRVPSHLFTFERGVRAYRRRSPRRANLAPLERIDRWLKAIAEAARATQAEFYRLELKRQLLQQRAKNRRSDSRLDDAITLIMASPIITIPMMAKSLKMTQTGAARILEILGPHLTEITERPRYRAWRA